MLTCGCIPVWLVLVGSIDRPANCSLRRKGRYFDDTADWPATVLVSRGKVCSAEQLILLVTEIPNTRALSTHRQWLLTLVQLSEKYFCVTHLMGRCFDCHLRELRYH